MWAYLPILEIAWRVNEALMSAFPRSMLLHWQAEVLHASYGKVDLDKILNTRKFSLAGAPSPPSPSPRDTPTPSHYI